MNIARDHPAFAGHFPGRPVLPAVVILTEVLAAVATRTGRPPQHWTITVAKFPSAGVPGEPLTLTEADTPSGGIRFEVRSASGIVASGTLALRHAS